MAILITPQEAGHYIAPLVAGLFDLQISIHFVFEI
jgi:hypothetical protein